MNNNYYFYEHYLANIALNLEVCFNLCEQIIYLKLILQKLQI